MLHQQCCDQVMSRSFNKQSFCAVVVILTLAFTIGCVTDSSDAGSGSPATITLPTPIQDGVWNNLTVEQARALASFPLLVPVPIPAPLELTNIIVLASPTTGSHGTAHYAELHFRAQADTPAVQLLEITSENTVNAGPSAKRSTLEINGWTIHKVTDPRGGGKTTLSYSWNSDGTSYALVALLPPSNVTEVQLEQLIANLKFEQ